MSDELVLGVDIGTGSTKGVLCDAEGNILASAVHKNQMTLPRPGFAQMDALNHWWGSVVSVCTKLTASDEYIQCGAQKLAAVCVSGLGPALVVTDREGQPLHEAILYGIDTRAEKQIEKQTEMLGEQAILSRCGKALSSQAVGPKLAWVRENVPGVEAGCPWYSTHSFVVKQLCGRWILDHHTASQCDPLYDVIAQEWACDWAEQVLPGLVLPELVWPGEIVGTVLPQAAAVTGLPVGLPVLAGTVDAWAEAYSVGVKNPGDLMVMYGSTMFVVQILSAPTVSSSLWTTSGILPGSHCLAAGMSTSGSLTTWIQDLVGGAPIGDLVEEARRVPPGSDGLVVLPYFAGERSPIYDPDARGTIMGLTLRHGRGHLFRAAYEGVAYGLRHIIEELDRCSGRGARVIAVGGGTRGDLWSQIVSDVCGIRQIVPKVSIGAAYGDALLAAQSVGLVPWSEDWLEVDHVVEPYSQKRGTYDELYCVFRGIYTETADLMHRLARMQQC